MATISDVAIAKIEFVRDITVAYLTNIYPKPLTALSEDVRQRTIEQHRKEINEFIVSLYTTISGIVPEK